MQTGRHHDEFHCEVGAQSRQNRIAEQFLKGEVGKRQIKRALRFALIEGEAVNRVLADGFFQFRDTGIGRKAFHLNGEGRSPRCAAMAPRST